MKGRLIIYGVFAFAIIVVAVVLLSRFRLTGSSPRNNAKNVDPSADITFTFSKALASLPTITSSPTVLGQPSLNKKVVTIKLAEPLNYGTLYTISLAGIKSTSGSTLSPQAITFITARPSVNLSAVLQNLPHSTDQYSIDYVASSQTFSIDISSDPPQTAESAALNWLAQYGVNQKNSHITFYLQPGVSGSNSVGP